jgi:hypothetical protein
MTDDYYFGSGVFAGELADVTIFVVQSEQTARDSFDFNLNHPVFDAGRYSAHIPWGTDRYVSFDVGNWEANRIFVPAGLVGIGEPHTFAFVNSALEDQRLIRIDGRDEAFGEGALSNPAGDVQVGWAADIRLYEFRIYAPSPTPKQRVFIEGDLACRWNLRTRLPQDHPFYAPEADDDTGCP